MKRKLELSVSMFAASLLLAGCAELLPAGGGAGSAGVTAPATKTGKRATGPSREAPTATSSAAGTYSVTLGVTNSAGRLGALQFNARAKGGSEWQGNGASVACRNVSGAGMIACNNNGGGLLSCGLVDTAGISTPKDLVVCSVSSSKPVAAADFTISVVDATGPDMRPAKAIVGVTKVAAN